MSLVTGPVREAESVGKTKPLNGMPNFKTFNDFLRRQEAIRRAHRAPNISPGPGLSERAVGLRL